jgi:protease-4
MSESPRGSTGPDARLVVALVAALLLGAALAPVAYDATRADGPDGSVAVVPLSGAIGSASADATVEDLREARRNDSVKAVVLDVNSPGGGVAASERLYLAVARLSAEKPVVASAGAQAASGGYYAMLPAERVYVLPSSIVGSVGAYAQTGAPFPDGIVRSGPDKASSTTQQTRRQVEAIQESFLDAVFEHRGDRLELTREELAHAKVYRGSRAVSLGVADEIGTLEDAVADAAERAGVDSYDVYRKEPERRGVILLQADDGANGSTVVVREGGLGYEGIETTQFYLLHGRVVDDAEEVSRDGGA